MRTNHKPKESRSSASNSARELRSTYDIAIKKMKSMSAKDRFQTMVDAGIYTKKGTLRKCYKG